MKQEVGGFLFFYYFFISFVFKPEQWSLPQLSQRPKISEGILQESHWH